MIRLSNKWLKFYFAVSKYYLIAVVCWLWGYFSQSQHLFPYAIVRSVEKGLVDYLFPEDARHKTIADTLLQHPQEFSADSANAAGGFKLFDESFHDPGFLLISRFDARHGQVIVQLVKIDGFEVIHTWVPNIDGIIANDGFLDVGPNSRERYRVQHPLLLENGSIVFHSGEGALVRLDLCSKIEWQINRFFHHSIELDNTGNLLVPINLRGDLKIFKTLGPEFKDDGYAVVTQEGNIVGTESIATMLMNSGYEGLLLGVGKLEIDRIHLNDAQPIHYDSGIARAGDVAFSSRHLSSVFLYRPSVKKIVWLKTGPWLNQHDVNILPDGRFSIFNNNIVRTNKRRAIKLPPSELFVYDPINGELTEPYKEVMASADVFSATEGRATILNNSDAFIEEQNQSRLLRISTSRVVWEFTNSISSKSRGELHWSTYLTPEQVDLSHFKKGRECSVSY